MIELLSIYSKINGVRTAPPGLKTLSETCQDRRIHEKTSGETQIRESRK